LAKPHRLAVAGHRRIANPSGANFRFSAQTNAQSLEPGTYR
jgi:hypothetical protein